MNASSEKISSKVLSHFSNFLETVNAPSATPNLLVSSLYGITALRTTHDFQYWRKRISIMLKAIWVYNMKRPLFSSSDMEKKARKNEQN